MVLSKHTSLLYATMTNIFYDYLKTCIIYKFNLLLLLWIWDLCPVVLKAYFWLSNNDIWWYFVDHV